MTSIAVPEKTKKTPALAQRPWLVAGCIAVIFALAVFGWRWWTLGRFIEHTDDAYVRADILTVSPHIAGYVATVAVADNQAVRQGDVLVTLDDRDYRARLDDAEAAVAAAAATLDAGRAGAATLDAQIEQQRSVIAQAQADVEAARAEAERRDADADRYRQLLADEAASDQRWEQARSEARRARAALTRASAAARAQSAQRNILQRRRDEATAAIAQARAQLAAARAKLKLAQLDLEHTVLRAARNGVVGQRSVRPGQYVETGMPLLALVPMDEVYVIANFKETQLHAMRIGQPVEIEVDTYAGRPLHGRVLGLSPASGAEFALLPPDNATGNFTKVVQRLPVKIGLDRPPRDLVLRPGMSVIARIDTRAAPATGERL